MTNPPLADSKADFLDTREESQTPSDGLWNRDISTTVAGIFAVCTLLALEKIVSDVHPSGCYLAYYEVIVVPTREDETSLEPDSQVET